jgi:hypothetical protein
VPTRKPKPLTPSPAADNPEQYRRFIDMAREVETDETPGATDGAFERVIRAPSKGRDQSTKAPPHGSTRRREG